VNLALSRMGQKSLDLLQYHIWKYEDSNYLYVSLDFLALTEVCRINLYHLASLRSSGKIRHLGLTNTDLPHLQLLAASGFTIATNQVSISLLDRRVEKGEMGKWCAENGVGLLGYGTLLGGFVSEKWVGRPEPGAGELKNWSLKKYKRFIDVACVLFCLFPSTRACLWRIQADGMLFSWSWGLSTASPKDMPSPCRP